MKPKVTYTNLPDGDGVERRVRIKEDQQNCREVCVKELIGWLVLGYIRTSPDSRTVVPVHRGEKLPTVKGITAGAKVLMSHYKPSQGNGRTKHVTTRATYKATLWETESDGTERWDVERNGRSIGSVASWNGCGYYLSKRYGINWGVGDAIARDVAEGFEEHFPTEDSIKETNSYF